MSTAIGTRQCGTTGCSRLPERHADGRCVHAFCPTCEERVLSSAFGAQPGGAPLLPASVRLPADRLSAVAAVGTTSR
jgi:hypothetical protein